MSPKNVVLLGATGSIGTSAQKVAADLPDHVRLIGLASRTNIKDLEKATQQFKPLAVGLTDENSALELQNLLGKSTTVHSGAHGLIELATMPEADIVLIAIVGIAGLAPALAAIRAGKDVAIASKEILVMAGDLVMNEARRHNVKVLPVDSEHSAIFQCLEGKDVSSVKRIILTASGGPFRTLSREDFLNITPEQALQHPSWDMGSKITVDSATMFNKGLEMIEARCLFEIEMNRVDVLVHPQSVIHSMVEFLDGSVLAQLSDPNMCYPIQYALTWPQRISNSIPSTNLAKIGALTFEDPDSNRFPSLRLAHEAGNLGGTMPAVLNAANEVAVANFMEGKIKFLDIFHTVERVMQLHHKEQGAQCSWIASPTLDVILEADLWARKEANRFV